MASWYFTPELNQIYLILIGAILLIDVLKQRSDRFSEFITSILLSGNTSPLMRRALSFKNIVTAARLDTFRKK